MSKGSVCVFIYVNIYVYMCTYVYMCVYVYIEGGGTKTACAFYNFCGISNRFSQKQLSSNVARKKMRKVVVLCNSIFQPNIYSHTLAAVQTSQWQATNRILKVWHEGNPTDLQKVLIPDLYHLSEAINPTLFLTNIQACSCAYTSCSVQLPNLPF